jgi:hypothetical protein
MERPPDVVKSPISPIILPPICLTLLVPSLLMFYPAIQYYRRRHLFPISMRKPILSLMGSVCLIFYCILLCIVWTIPHIVPWFFFDFLSSSFLLMAAFVYLWRAWLLYFFSRLAAENVKGELQKNRIGKPFTSFFQQRRYFVENRYFVMYEMTKCLHRLR